MRLTIIKADNMVYINGVALSIDCSSLPAGFHALQWYGTFGEIETADEHGRMQQNLRISDLQPYQPFVDAWNAVNKTVRAAAVAKAAAVAEAAAAARPATVNVIAK